MTQLLEIRKKIVELYRKYDYVVTPAVTFILSMCGYIAIRNSVGFNAKLSSFPILFLLAAVSTFLPSSITLAVMVVYITAQVYGASLFMAITVILFAIIVFCFFLRFTPKYIPIVIVMPILMSMHIPYVIPITCGLLISPITIVPTSVGVFAYYFITGISSNMFALEQAANSDEPYILFTNVLNNVLKNEAMFVTIIVFALVTVVVYLIRNIKMDYSFEIAIGVGATANMLGFIILMLKYNVGVSLIGVILFSIISAGIVFGINFMYRPLIYAGTENVQFEDDDYYYYVKAIPKVKIAGAKLNERHIITRRNNGFDDDDEDIEEIEMKLMGDESIFKSFAKRRRIAKGAAANKAAKKAMKEAAAKPGADGNQAPAGAPNRKPVRPVRSFNGPTSGAPGKPDMGAPKRPIGPGPGAMAPNQGQRVAKRPAAPTANNNKTGK